MILPTVISNSPFLAEVTVITNSGKDVPITITTIVINLVDIFKLSDIYSVELTIKSLEKIIIPKEIIVNIIDFILLYFGFKVSIFLNLLIILCKYKQNIKNNKINTNPSNLVKVLSVNSKQNVNVVISNNGNSFDTVTVFILIVLTILARPIISNIFTTQLPITLAKVKS